MNVIFDLDGTLALDDHRLHFLNKKPKQWENYFERCDRDPVNSRINNVLHALAKDKHHVEIWTGRSRGPKDVWFHKTLEWLQSQARIRIRTCAYAVGMPEDYTYIEDLKMRPFKDYRSSVSLKGKWLKEAAKKGTRPDLVFEDMEKMVEFFRSEKITCVQVQERSWI